MTLSVATLHVAHVVTLYTLWRFLPYDLIMIQNWCHYIYLNLSQLYFMQPFNFKKINSIKDKFIPSDLLMN